MRPSCAWRSSPAAAAARCALGSSRDGIVPVTVAEMPQAARRPADASLDSGRARRELGWQPRGLAEAIRDGRHGPD